jgi:adenylate kinase
VLRAAIAEGTRIGLQAKDVMARGELVPDDIVVAIVAERIARPDARGGFILDGFPRTVPQAVALDRLLAEKGLKLDAVIELKVDESILLRRIETRVAQMRARGETLRADDNADALRKRLMAYREQTAPVTGYYALQGTLKVVDGMAPIAEVAAAIDAALAGGQGATAQGRKPAGGPSRTRKSAAKGARKGPERDGARAPRAKTPARRKAASSGKGRAGAGKAGPGRPVAAKGKTAAKKQAAAARKDGLRRGATKTPAKTASKTAKAQKNKANRGRRRLTRTR